jgi:hypothetical protein
MQYTDYTEILPAQLIGKDLEVSAECRPGAVGVASSVFLLAKERLLDVNSWHETAGLVSAKFEVMDVEARPMDRQVKEGDFIRIDIPGPGSTAGEGYDWVQVIALREYEKENTRSIAFQVRPTSNPVGGDPSIAHFYGEVATSTFAVNQVDDVVAAFVVDRNLLPNDEGAHLLDKIRNSTIGIAALGMFSKVQWQNLVNGIVKSASPVEAEGEGGKSEK